MSPLLALACLASDRPDRGVEIIREVEAAYRSLRSYSDTGESVVTCAGHVERLRFRTAFKRRKRLFLWCGSANSPEPIVVIWPAKNRLRHIWWGFDASSKTLPYYLSLTSVPIRVRATLQTVPSLLMPEDMADLFAFRGMAEWVDSEVLDGVSCEKVRMTTLFGDVTYWVDRRTKLIRRFDVATNIDYGAGSHDPKADLRSLKFDLGIDGSGLPKAQDPVTHSPGWQLVVKVVTVYHPRANPTLKARDFAFVPPKR